VLTLGANPLLQDFLFDVKFNACARLAARPCIKLELARYKTVGRLRDVYSRLLDAPENHVVAFLYHKTVPLSFVGASKSVQVLFQELKRRDQEGGGTNKGCTTSGQQPPALAQSRRLWFTRLLVSSPMGPVD
jgi:hypothetical protein